MTCAARACTGALLVGILTGLAVAVEGGEPFVISPEQTRMQQRSIADVLRDQTDRLLSVPGVVGVAEGRCDGHPCIKIFVKQKTAKLLRELPSTLDGYPVSIEETGEFRAHDR